MGNHGGATAEGQAGHPRRPRHHRGDRRRTGPAAHGHAAGRPAQPAGTPVYVSEEAMAADGVILVNRIKPHTDFESTRLGSGILKMAAIGLGGSEGAAACHRAAGRLGFEAVLPAVAKVVASRTSRWSRRSASSRTAGTSSPGWRRSPRGQSRSGSGAPGRSARADAGAPLPAHRRPGHRRDGQGHLRRRHGHQHHRPRRRRPPVRDPPLRRRRNLGAQPDAGQPRQRNRHRPRRRRLEVARRSDRSGQHLRQRALVDDAGDRQDADVLPDRSRVPEGRGPLLGQRRR